MSTVKPHSKNSKSLNPFLRYGLAFNRILLFNRVRGVKSKDDLVKAFPMKTLQINDFDATKQWNESLRRKPRS